MVSRAISACVFAVLLTSAYGASYTWSGGADTGLWSDGGNWNPSGVPGAADTVTIHTNDQVTINVNVTIDSLEFTSGKILQIQTFTVTDTLNIDGGSYVLNAGSSYLNVNQLNVSAASQFTFRSGVLFPNITDIQATVQLAANDQKTFGPGSVTFQNVTTTSATSLNFLKGATVVFGSLTLVANTQLQSDPNTPLISVSGNLNIAANSQVQVSSLNSTWTSLTVGDGAMVTILGGSTLAVTQSVTTSGSATIRPLNPSTFTSTGTVNVAGTLSANGNINLLGTGSCQVSQLSTEGASQTVVSACTISSIKSQTGTIVVQQSLQSSLIQSQNLVILGSTGAVVNSTTLNAQGQLLTLTNVVVNALTSSVAGNVQITNATLNLGTTTLSGAQFQGQGITITAGGVTVNNGVTLNQASFTANSLKIGSIAQTVVNGGSISIGSLVINDNAKFSGHGAIVNLGNVTSNAPPVTYSIDTATLTCATSPCPTVQSTQPISELYITA